MSSPLDAISRWRAAENALESALALAVAAGAWGYCWKLFSTPHVGRAMTLVEEVVVLGGAVALTSWVVSFHLFMIGWRRPRFIALWSTVFSMSTLYLTRMLARMSFEGRCADPMLGEIIPIKTLLDGDPVELACVIGAVPGNPYLPGTIVLPFYDGIMSWGMLGLMVVFSVVASLSFRDRRMWAPQIGGKLLDYLALGPAAGKTSALGGLAPDSDVVACANPTLWGEPCGQLYSAEKTFLPGEWCGRCKQPFTAADRKLRFSVVSLVTPDIDVLNGLERMDTSSWPMGEGMPPDARISGKERWAKVGEIELPEVISVAQALSLVHDRLEGWKGSDVPEAAKASLLATHRASRICCWIWFGRVNHRLTFARPTNRVRFALGSMRLRDLVPDAGEILTLQLDIGLLPLEVRSGFRRSFVDETRPDEVRNSKADLWIPVSPPPHLKGEPGVWVDRVEGDALRAWLATDRLRPAEARGVSVPLGYRPHSSDNAGKPLPERPIGRLDYVRHPIDDDTDEPLKPRLPGVSIAEWDWFEGEQIELLRQEALVLVDTAATQEEVS